MRYKVLVVDDDIILREGIEMVLEECGYETLGAGSLGEALQKLAGCTPDMLIVDMKLPDGEGQVLVREIKKCEETKKMPVIFISASREAERVAKEAGADLFISKPFDLDRLIQAVQSRFAFGVLRA